MRHEAYVNGKSVPIQYKKSFSAIQTFEDRIDQPLRWKKPSRIFVNSMGDLFHQDVPDSFIGGVFGVMAEAHWHTFIVLTKRAERLKQWSKCVTHYPSGDRSEKPIAGWPPNVWIGISVEDQITAAERIPYLLEVDAAVRVVSYEPALGPVDFSNWVKKSIYTHTCVSIAGALKSRNEAEQFLRAALESGKRVIPANDCNKFDYTTGCRGHQANRLDWIICGGESGPNARPMHPDWARAARDQCQLAGVPFFFKQHGGQIDKGGRVLDGRTHDDFPEQTVIEV